MLSILPLLQRIAANAKIAPIAANILMATMTTQPEPNPIEAATRRNARLFAAYITILVFTAIVIAVFTWLTWDSGNKVQDAIRADSDARIEEAEQGVEKLKHENLLLSGSVAGLQEDASNAKARAANAERALLELQERLAHRRIDPSQHARLVALLLPFAGSTVTLTKLGDPEAGRFADDIISVLSDARWNVNLKIIGMMAPPVYGLRCSINGQSEAGQSLAKVIGELPTSSVDFSPSLPKVADITVGLKPPP
jgi:hypothetical protein